MARDFSIKNNILVNYKGKAADIVIQDGITMIEKDCFLSSNIINVFVPDSVLQIGKSAFAFCRFLEKIELSRNIEEIRRDTFRCCSNLEKIQIPSEVKRIGTCAFFKCNNLSSVLLPDGLKIIGSKAFGYCEALKVINIPDSVEIIGDGAFIGCDNLEYIKLPKRFDNASEYCRITGRTVCDSDENIEENNSANQDKFKTIANALGKRMEEERKLSTAGRDTFADLYEINAEDFIYQSVYDYYPSDNLLKAFESWGVFSIKQLLLMCPQIVIQDEAQFGIKLEEVFSILESAKLKNSFAKNASEEKAEHVHESMQKVGVLPSEQIDDTDLQYGNDVIDILKTLQRKYKQEKANTIKQVLKDNPELNQSELYRYARTHCDGSAQKLLIEYGILATDKRNGLSSAEVKELGDKIITQLKEKYAKSPAKLVKNIFEENPDINQGYLYRYAKEIKKCKVRKLLEDEGVVCPEEKQGMSNEELRQYGDKIIKYLKEKYPTGTEKLASQICEEESIINQSYLYKYSKTFYYCGVRELFEKNGIIALKKSDCFNIETASKESVKKRGEVSEKQNLKDFSFNTAYKDIQFEKSVKGKLEKLQKKYEKNKADTIIQVLNENPDLSQSELYRYARLHFDGSAKELLIKYDIIASGRHNKMSKVEVAAIKTNTRKEAHDKYENTVTKTNINNQVEDNADDKLARTGKELILELKRRYTVKKAESISDVYDNNPDISRVCIYQYARKILKVDVKVLFEAEGIIKPKKNESLCEEETTEINRKGEIITEHLVGHNSELLFEEANQINETVSFFELNFSREARWHLYAIKVKKIRQLAKVTRQRFYYATSDASIIEKEIHEKLELYIKEHVQEQHYSQKNHISEPISPDKETKSKIETSKQNRVEKNDQPKKKIKIKISGDSVMKEIKTRGKSKI